MSDTVQYAGFWRRFLARIIDSIILLMISLVLTFAIQGSLFPKSASMVSPVQIVHWTLFIAYEVVFLVTAMQATPGKRMMSVYIARASDGGRITPEQSILRYFVLWGPALLIMVIITMNMSTLMPQQPANNMAPADMERFQKLMLKQVLHHEQMTADDKRFFEDTNAKMQAMNSENMSRQAHLSPADQQRFTDIQQKMSQGQRLTPDEQQFFSSVIGKSFGKLGPMLMLQTADGIYMIVLALMIGLSAEKAGLHDRVAGTRAQYGVAPAARSAS